MIQLTIPVYYTKEFKRKKDKTFLISLNWYRNAFYQEQNLVKRYFHDLIKEQLKGQSTSIIGQYEVIYTYYYRNSISDLPNVTPMCSKWVNDVLQELNIVQNDNVQYLVREVHEVGGQDRENPRAEILINTIV